MPNNSDTRHLGERTVARASLSHAGERLELDRSAADLGRDSGADRPRSGEDALRRLELEYRGFLQGPANQAELRRLVWKRSPHAVVRLEDGSIHARVLAELRDRTLIVRAPVSWDRVPVSYDEFLDDHDPADPKDPDAKQAWLEVCLQDGEGEPIEGEAYLVILPDGTEKRGNLNKQGEVRFDGIEPGHARVCFPDIDKGDWRRIGTSEDPKVEDPWLQFVIEDEEGEPLVGAEYVVAMPDGTQKKGKLDGRGAARIEDVVAEDAHVSFPEFEQAAAE